MKKKKVMSAAALSLCLAMGLTMGASADSRKVVTLGADLTDQQKQIVMNYFGVTADEVDILTINNQDERDHLGAYVPLEQIGTHTYSCALVSPTRSGGIQVKTANLDWVTCNMIATTLSTSGVVNCDVIAASPITVSGTGALTGIIMAYEQASGEELDPQKKELATEELVITGQLADTVGQKEATAIVNEAKTEIISQNITDITVIQNIVNEAATNNDAQLSEDEVNMVTELLDKISQEDYNFEDMKDTLERVDENVGVLELDNQTAAEDGIEDYIGESEEVLEDVEAEPSILDNTNDDVFGEDVIMGSTLEPETEAPAETEVPSDGYVDAPADISNLEGALADVPVESEVYSDGYEDVPAVTEVPVETEAPAETEAPTETPAETEAPTEATTETEGMTEPVYTLEDLNEEKSMIYKQTFWYLDRVLGITSEHSDSQEYAEINEMEVTELEIPEEETNQKLKDKFSTFLLKLLAEGPETTELDEKDTEEYGVPEVKEMCEELHDILIDDTEHVLVDVDPDVRQTVYDEAEVFFKKLYGIEEEVPEEELPEEELPEELPDEEASTDGEIPEATTDGTVEG